MSIICIKVVVLLVNLNDCWVNLCTLCDGMTFVISFVSILIRRVMRTHTRIHMLMRVCNYVCACVHKHVNFAEVQWDYAVGELAQCVIFH